MADDLQQRWRRETAGARYLTAEDPRQLQEYLAASSFLIPEERVLSTEVAGEGNMNVTLRVTTNRRQFIVKQSRPWVARFPVLDAPIERIMVERGFYHATRGDHFLAGHMPELLRADPDHYVLVLEDLGLANDLSTVYQEGEGFTRRQLATLLRFAGRLHALKVDDFVDNRPLKTLNHAHIFDLPFRPDNGFPLDAIYPGLAEVARPLQHDARLREAAGKLGEIYLADGPTLLHGDFYPGSFLNAEERIYVIDTEFAHLGRAEYDIGVLMAHLLLSRTPPKRIRQLETDYAKPPGYDTELARRFSYVEIIRRLIGIAQLQVSLTLDERRQLLERARSALI
ncbi:phosphotransferase [Lewinella sp. IMCC34183]|uniref:phosphotransferase n=1 Tax=Lewinella sp. IMCC34183 TaxID=2248762 RepID=UPI000E2872E4|nr:phosphotransferase [Lewinella sp. IMCC34183]